MAAARQGGAVVISSYRGQPGSDRLRSASAADEAPRREYVELADALGAELLDAERVERGGTRLTRAALRVGGLPAAQVVEAFLRHRRDGPVVTWADKLGLPLALLHKLTRSRRDLVLVSQWLTKGEKAFFVRRLRVHSHVKAIVGGSGVQMQGVVRELGVPPAKVHHLRWPVDDAFFSPIDEPVEDRICSVGWEARDYPTLAEAMVGLDLDLDIVVGAVTATPSYTVQDADAPGGDLEPPHLTQMRSSYTHKLFGAWMEQVGRDGLPPNVHVRTGLGFTALRALYARARFVVVPLHETDFDAGTTATLEAMAMGKAVVLSETSGIGDLVEHEVHGLLVPPGDPGALRAAIARLAADPQEAERLGRAGRARIEERHRLDDYVRRLADIVRGT